jgi:hypothetical protein
MDTPTPDEFDNFKAMIECERSARGQRFISRALELLDKDGIDEWDDIPYFDLEDPEVRNAVAQSMAEAVEHIGWIMRDNPVPNWFASDPAFQISKKKSSIVMISDDEVRQIATETLDRLLTASKDRERLAKGTVWDSGPLSDEEIDKRSYRLRTLRRIPNSFQSRFFKWPEWVADLGIAVKHYLDGTSADAAFEISRQVKQAREGLEQFVQASESDAARYYGLFFDSMRYPLDSDNRMFRRGIEKRLASLTEMEKHLKDLRVVKRRDEFTNERAFISEVFHCNFRAWGDGKVKTVKALIDAGFLRNALDDKAVERVYMEVQKQIRAIKAIRNLDSQHKSSK